MVELLGALALAYIIGMSILQRTIREMEGGLWDDE